MTPKPIDLQRFAQDVDQESLRDLSLPMDVIRERATQELLKTIDKVAWRMIGHGLYFHKGWRVGYRLLPMEPPSMTMRWEVYPVPPAGGTWQT